MSEFGFQNGVLHAEQVPLTELAEKFGTPFYVYSRALIEKNWKAFQQQLTHPHMACYAVKANSNLAILQLLARLGAGFDVVSAGEIARVLKAGGDPARIVFSGVGKTHTEIEYALDVGIAQFNVESSAELTRISEIASSRQQTATVSLRINPDVDAKTHPYIATGLEANKFGIPMREARETYRLAASLPGLKVTGADCHIGSQLTDVAPFLDAMERMLRLVDELREDGIELSHLDMGGGLGVAYQGEKPPAVNEYIQALLAKLKSYPQLALYLEPGRAIVANAGLLLTRVEYVKESERKNFIIVDAAMNDLLRPSLYQAYHEIQHVQQQTGSANKVADIVGPVCETGDFLAQGRKLAAKSGDLLAVMSAGAYGFTMSSNYNTRVRPAEVLVDGDEAILIRQREQMEQLWQGEHLLP